MQHLRLLVSILSQLLVVEVELLVPLVLRQAVEVVAATPQLVAVRSMPRVAQEVLMVPVRADQV